ncbi:MAG: NrsF family protein [Alphaproteobacteria bacterium]
MSKKNNIDDLIGNLTDELEPIKPMGCPMRRIAIWFVTSAIFVALCAYSMGLRHDISTLYTNPHCFFELTLMAITGIFAALSSSYLTVPDMRGQKWLTPTTFTTLGVFTLWNTIRFILEGDSLRGMDFDHCMGEGGFMAIVPVAFLIFMMRHGTTCRPILTAVMNTIAIAALGYVALRFTCPMNTVAHATISHLLPYIALGGVFAMIARKLYKW